MTLARLIDSTFSAGTRVCRSRFFPRSGYRIMRRHTLARNGEDSIITLSPLSPALEPPGKRERARAGLSPSFSSTECRPSEFSAWKKGERILCGASCSRGNVFIPGQEVSFRVSLLKDLVRKRARELLQDAERPREGRGGETGRGEGWLLERNREIAREIFRKCGQPRNLLRRAPAHPRALVSRKIVFPDSGTFSKSATDYRCAYLVSRNSGFSRANPPDPSPLLGLPA